ncbi:MAG: hypothetical protein R3C15_17325 [Thermoleophilia bacterium]
MSAIETEFELGEETEAERVVRWRAEELERAGYDERNAIVVALRNDIDLHVAVELLERGCPVDTALKILL